MHIYYKIERESYVFTKPKRVVNKLIFNVVDKYDNVTSVSRCIMIFLIEKCKKTLLKLNKINFKMYEPINWERAANANQMLK